jgi:tRNA dimethylallyltransferase
MFDSGFLAEIRQLQRLPRPFGRTARQALGYKEVLDWLDRTGDLVSPRPPDSVITEIQLRTRQFAKRQHTWFRNLEECRAVEISGTETAGDISEKISGDA